MSTLAQLSVLALLTTSALAQPFVQAHEHDHQHGHIHSGSWLPSGTIPLASGTGTRPHRTGTGLATGSGRSKPSSTLSTIATNISPAPVALVGESSSSDCDDVTITSTTKVTVTVTGTLSSSVVSSNKGKSTVWTTLYSTITPSSSSASVASAVAQSSSTLSSSSTVSTPSSSSSSSSSPSTTTTPSVLSTTTTPSSTPSPSTTSTSTTSSTWIAPSSSSEVSSSSYEAPPVAIVSQAAAVVTSALAAIIPTTTSTPAPSSTWAASSGSGKRGIAYNYAAPANLFVGSSQISWAYNWAPTPVGWDGGELDSGVTYLPLLWDDTEAKTSTWKKDAADAISNGATHLFSFNEPDLSSQANMDPKAAADAYRSWMEPFAGQAKLCAPAVTNGGGSMGLNWLQSFLSECSDCTIDCLNIHWYDSATNIDYFKSHLTEAINKKPGAPVFVSEFGGTGSDEEINTFLQTVMPWMDSLDGVAGYAYFMAADGLLVNSTTNEPSLYGSTFRNYVN